MEESVKLYLLQYFVCSRHEGSDETVQMHRLALAFASLLDDNYLTLIVLAVIN